MAIADFFSHAAQWTSRQCGRPLTFGIAFGIVLVWGVTGPIFHYSDTWQLVINTGTTVITFLMVFLIQNTQNRDNAALQAKLDELIRVTQAKNEFIGIEHLSDKQLEEILERCERHRPEVVRRAEAQISADRRSDLQRSRKRATSRAKRAAAES
jgi:low affinity Fe/Cu permease